MIIYFLRHANAGEKRRNPARDEKRPLDKQGIEQSRWIGRALALLDTQVDAVISSPLKRATQTASIVANEIGFDGKIQLAGALRPGAEYEKFQDLLRDLSKRESIMVVGHDPTLSGFCSLLLSSGVDDDILNLRKGAVARVELSGRKDAALDWCLTPKVAKTLQTSDVMRSLPKTARK